MAAITRNQRTVWREVSGKPDKSLLRHSTSSLPPIKPVVYRVATIGGKSHILRTESTSVRPQSQRVYLQGQNVYPQGQHVFQAAKVMTTKQQAPQKQMTDQFVRKQYNTHPNNGIRIVRSPHGPVHMQYKRPVVIYQEPIKPMVAVVPQPNTVPHVRLGAYRPKVIQEYFSPYSIRQYVANQSLDSLQNSSYTTDYGSYVDSEVTHAWYPADEEQAYLLHRNEEKAQQERAQRKPRHEKRKKRTKKSKSVYTSTDNQHRTKSTQFMEGGTRYTIIDYLVDDRVQQGPISTSTPRNEADLTTTLDPHYDLIDEHQRQRRPREGSLDKMPLLY